MLIVIIISHKDILDENTKASHMDVMVSVSHVSNIFNR